MAWAGCAQSSGAYESFLTFVLLGDSEGPPTDSLAQIIWEQMQGWCAVCPWHGLGVSASGSPRSCQLAWPAATATDVTSALYKGPASRYIDMDYQPVFKFSLPPAQPDDTTCVKTRGGC